MDRITILRGKIDEIDGEILNLLKERVETSRLIGKIKKEIAMPIRDPEREREKYQCILRQASELGLNVEVIREIYKNIISMSVKAQEQ
ncbi:MAG: chorismate mutase [Candidatus Bathyarchaeia archaeon]